MVHDPRVSTQLSRLGGVYRDPARVDRDASTLCKSVLGSHLRPITAEMVENNGRSTVVLVLQGTIAIHFKGQTFQQLVDIYLPTGYPRGPPVCFVRLGENMYLKENHPHVGSDGQVYLPYLHEWKASTHDLVELVVAMSSVFSNEPPVFTRAAAAESEPPPPPVPPVAVAHPPPPPPPPPAFAETNLPSWRRDAEAILAAEAAEANAAAATARHAEEERLRQQQEDDRKRLLQRQQEQQQERQQQQQLEWEVARCNSIRDQVALKLQQHLQKVSGQVQQQVQSDQRDQAHLERAREQKIDLQLQWYQQKEKELQQLVAVASESCQDLAAWLEQHQKATSNNNAKTLTIDEQVQPATALHEQMLDLSAENAVLTDLLYMLDRGLDKGRLSCDEHLKQVRRLAKRQFLVRAHLIKINQVLLNKKQTGMDQG